MKRIIFKVTAILFIAQSGFAQNLNYEMSPRNILPITREEINSAKTLIDLNSGYAKNWITDYVSSEISVTYHGNLVKVITLNDTLNQEQKNILNMADMGSDITIDVIYKSKNAVTHRLEKNLMNFKITLVADSISMLPKTKAEYTDGQQKMKDYIEEAILFPISKKAQKEFQKGVVRFTINEQGEITNSKIVLSSKDKKIDQLLLEAIQKMPNWKAAENSQGKSVKQEFDFILGEGGC
jgi:TonB family protein